MARAGDIVKVMPMSQAEVLSTHEFMIFAEEFQFYIQDEKSEADLSEGWDDEARANLLAVGTGILSVGCVRDMDVPVIFEVHAARPDDDFSDFDQVVEASIDIPSGRVVVSGPGEDFYSATRIDVSPGTYGVLVHWGMLDEVDEEGFEGDDFYKVVLWADALRPVKVLKRWTMPVS